MSTQPPLLPAVAKQRSDGSVLMSFGDPAKGPHEQFDFHGSIDLAQAIAAAYSNCHTPDGEMARLRGAMKADDERLRLAAARVGIDAGCDAPEMMADEIQRLRSDSGYVTGFNDGFEHAKKTSLMIMEENSAFSIGDLVRKKSGSWWEGRVVGFYSTEQTADGVCVQLDKPMGPVQIYPASALELVEKLNPEPRENPQWTSEELQQFASQEAEPLAIPRLHVKTGGGHASVLLGAQQLIATAETSPPSSSSDYAELEALAKAATPGPHHIYTFARDDSNWKANEAFIAAVWPQVVLDLISKARQTPPPQTHVAGKAEAFDKIVAARAAHVVAVAAYNDRLIVVRSERERGNHSMRLDDEYEAMSETHATWHRTCQELADAALATTEGSEG